MIGDTILAVASPPGAGARGILRISGSDAFAVAQQLIPALPGKRGTFDSHLSIAGQSVEVFCLTFTAPASFTGEDIVELHLPGSPMLLDMVERQCLDAAEQLGKPLRRATPGEFTRRAFENGRLGLAEAEAIQQLIHAESDEQARFAASVLDGGLRQRVEDLRRRLLDAHAMLEAGLDFEEEETGAVAAAAWRPGVQQVRDQLQALTAQLPATSRGAGALFLLGAANAGKSSLVNALTGESEHLVSDVAGTTRDILEVTLQRGDRQVRLLDGPGDLRDPQEIDAVALQLRQRLADTAAGLILVVDQSSGSDAIDQHTALDAATQLPAPILAVVLSKQDQPPAATLDHRTEALPPDVPRFIVSSHTGQGIDRLRAFLLQQTSAGTGFDILRLQEALQSATKHLDAVLQADAGLWELCAADLQQAARHLDAWAEGRSSPEDLLDRIFAGFCLGK